jgi:LuxR family transcriptional regulator, maltose regulon positive regulatory protein
VFTPPDRMPLAPAPRHGPFSRAPRLAADAAPVGLGRTAALFPTDFVHRRALVERLRTEHGAMLAVIIAPPGYGKSALIAEWAESDDRRFAWLGAEASDADDVAAGRVDTVLEGLDDDEPAVLVIDDAHRMTPGLLQQTVTELWKRLPANSLVAVAARTEPDLPLGRLRAHRALVEIRMRDLAMVPAEAAVLLRRAGLELEFSDVQTLVSRTEGWPAALYLAALSHGERAAEADSLPPFRGDDHLFAEYVRDEVLERLPRPSLTFLRRASILNELSGEACDAVLGVRRSALRIRQLAESSLLLEPVDAAHERYRWHPLLRELMNAQLRRREPELVPALHGVASSWHADHGDLDAAIEHAVAAGDVSRAGELLWGELASYISEDGVAEIERWLARFTPEAIAATRPLTMCAACAALMAGDAEGARRWIRELDPGPTSPGEPAGLENPALTLIEAMTADGGITRLRTAAERARRTLPPNSRWRAACLWLEGVAAHLAAHDRAVATDRLEQAAELAGREGAPIAVLAMTQRAMIAIETGDWGLAIELTDEVTASVSACRPPLPVEVLARAAAAAARAHEGRADEAKQDAHRVAVALVELDHTPAWFGAQIRLLLAHASLYLADVSGARSLLAQASRHARRAGPGTFEQWFDSAWSHLDTIAETSLTGPSALTIAELRVLRFLPSCRPFREIAAQLGVSANTVKTQAHAIYRKLGAGSRSEAVQLARDAGLLGQ